MSSTRSVGMNLDRPFKAGEMQQDIPRRLATSETGAVFQSSLCDEKRHDLIPGV